MATLEPQLIIYPSTNPLAQQEKSCTEIAAQSSTLALRSMNNNN